MPLLGIAAFNLLVTQRKLKSGSAIWTRRLRRLVGTKLGLALLILPAVRILIHGRRRFRRRREPIALLPTLAGCVHIRSCVAGFTLDSV
jgi:hypothetical protein